VTAPGAAPVRRALVIGFGLAGLAAARVLSDHVDEVWVADRDRLPDGAQARSGTPQARHIHNLLLRGLHELERLFPGFGAELEALGGVPIDLVRDMRFHSIWGWFPRYASDLRACVASRPLIEHVVRERVHALPKVRWLERRRAVALLGDAQRVRGVRFGSVEGEHGSVDIEADLVLDASGRSTHLPAWLEALVGHATPVTEVDAQLGYATRQYRIPPNAPDWRMLLVRNPWPSPRAGGILPLEGGRWIATLAGFSGDHPPIDDAGFRAFTRSLATPDIADALEAAEPLGEAIGYRQTANLWRHYERLPRWPLGLAALGDSACALNPLYGQGMSIAAQEAVLLRDLLERHGATLALGDRLRHALPALLAAPWAMATSEDYRYPGTRGASRSRWLGLRHRFGDAMARAAMHDRRLHYRWLRVVNLVDPPSALLWRAVSAGRPG
jgi:flavin-dependent dehydrogenase